MNTLLSARSSLVLSVAIVMVFMAACSTFYRGVVGLTAAMDSAAKEYAIMYKSGLIPPEVHERASKAHGEYQKAAGVAEAALTAYKLSGDATKFREAFSVAQKAAMEFATLIVPYLARDKAMDITENIQKASNL